MGLSVWLTAKSHKKSVSNILADLPPLVAAVQADVAALTDVVLAGQDPTAMAEEEMMQLVDRRNATHAVVVSAQRELYKAIGVWSSLPVQDVLSKLLYPEIASGRFVSPSEAHYEAVLVAVYRVWESAVVEASLDPSVHTPPQVLAAVSEAGDLYK